MSFQVKEYLPVDIYQSLEIFFSNPEKLEAKGYPDSGAVGGLGFLKYNDQAWRVSYCWGCDASEKINSLFLVIHSKDTLFVSVFDSEKKTLCTYSSGDLSLKEFFNQASLDQKCYDSLQSLASSFIVEKFPKSLWERFVRHALNEEAMEEIASIPKEITVVEDGKISKIGQQNLSFCRKEIARGTNGTNVPKGWLGSSLKVVLYSIALFLAYKVCNYVYESFEKPANA